MNTPSLPTIDLPKVEVPSLPDLPTVDASDLIDRAVAPVSRAARLLPWVDRPSTFKRVVLPVGVAVLVGVVIAVVVRRRRSDEATTSTDRERTPQAA